MAKKKVKKYKLKEFATLLAVLFLIIAVIVYYFYFRKDESSVTSIGASGAFSGFGGEVESSDNVMKVHFIDVGQGDCIFIRFPDGKTMLIDSGDKGKGKIITDYLDKLGVTTIDVLLGTHAHSDHIGSMTEIFEKYDVKHCFRPFVFYSGAKKSQFDSVYNVTSKAKKKQDASSEIYYKFLKAVKDEGCTWDYFNKDSDFEQTIIYEEQEYTYKFDFLTPTDNVPYIGYSDANDYSPLCLLSYGEFSVMFTGDASSDVEKEYLKYYSDSYTANVLKVGHHGSKTSSSKAFIGSLAPECAVIMCETGNKYKHPNEETMNTLFLEGISVYRTDMHGSIVLEVTPDGTYTFATENEVTPSTDLYKPGT